MTKPKTINPFRMFDGAVVPVWLLERPEVSGGAKLAYARLARYAGARGVAYPRLEKLATDLGVSKDQVRRYLRELEACGLITTTKSGFHRANRYRFLEHAWIRAKPVKAARGGISATSRGGISATPILIEESLTNQKDERITVQAGAVAAPPGAAAPRSPAARRVKRLLDDLTSKLTM